MSNEEVIANLVGLMTSFHLEIKALPDKLKCAKCKSVLKNACQVPCGCRFCRACINDVISRGHQFCPGGSQDCGATPLSTAVPDYRANKSVVKLTAKCPHAGCLHECPLADMEGHMRACLSKNIDCPFRELGCAQGALPGEEMSGHLLQESRSHSKILIGTVANISRDMEMLKRELLMKDEHMKNKIKLITDENKSMRNEMEAIKDENKSINDVNKSIKIDIKVLKDEVESIKIENESIKREKEVLCDRVRQLEEKLDWKIDESHQSDERDIAMVTVETGAVVSNRDEMEPVRGDIRSIRDQFDRMKCQMESIQMPAVLGQLDDWLIEEDMTKTVWWCLDNVKTSGKFGGEESCFIFELVSDNLVSRGELWIYLRIWAGPSASRLKWPFRGVVTVTIADKDKLEACSRQTGQCQIERPADNQFKSCDTIMFPHTALRGAGVHLERGVRVSCRIVPGAGQ